MNMKAQFVAAGIVALMATVAAGQTKSQQQRVQITDPNIASDAANILSDDWMPTAEWCVAKGHAESARIIANQADNDAVATLILISGAMRKCTSNNSDHPRDDALERGRA